MQRRTEHGFCIIPLSVHRPFFDFFDSGNRHTGAGTSLGDFYQGGEGRILYGAENHADADRTHGGGGGAAGFRLSGVLVRASRTVDAENRISRRIGAAFCRKDVFFVRSDRASDRSLQRVWHRFLYRAHRIHLNGMYRDNFLHNVCLFYDSKSQEIQIHAGRGVACYSGRTCS